MASAALEVETESPCQHEEKRGSKEEKRLGGGFGTSEARPKLKARRERGPPPGENFWSDEALEVTIQCYFLRWAYVIPGKNDTS